MEKIDFEKNRKNRKISWLICLKKIEFEKFSIEKKKISIEKFSSRKKIQKIKSIFSIFQMSHFFFKLNFLHEEKIFFDEFFFLNFIYFSSAFECIRSQLLTPKTKWLFYFLKKYYIFLFYLT